MPQDAFHVKRTVQELHALLRGGKINRVSQVNKDELTLIIYTGKSTVKLIVSTSATNARVCLSSVEKEPLAVAPNFCMLLRKHIQSAEILSVAQRPFERIVEIRLRCTGDFSESERVLICEVMGKYSNIVLVENGLILGALKTTALMDENHRVLFAGAKYEYPALQDKLSPTDGAGIRSRLKNFMQTNGETVDEESLARFLFDNVFGFALSTARELVKKAVIRVGSLENTLSSLQGAPIWEYVGDFFENEPCNPHVKTENGKKTDFFAFAVENGTPAPSLCKAQDEYYLEKEEKKAFDDKKRKLESAVRTLKKKSAKRLQDVTERLTDAEKAEENRIKGELLTANLYRIERGAKWVELENWYDEQRGKIRIALDERLSPSKNAQKYFKAYNKQKRAKEILTPMKDAEEKEIFYAESIFTSIGLAETQEDLKEIQTELIGLGLIKEPAKRAGAKKAEEVPFREYECDGFKILAGRNNVQNDRLLKSVSPDDIWLHTQKYHSSHVVVLAGGKQVPDKVLQRAGEICAYFSQGRNGDKIPVDYCKRKHVKKPSKAKAGFVTYTDYKTILVTPLLPS